MEKLNHDTLLLKSKLKGHEINWNQLFYFSVIASHGSIKGAAEALSLSASNLSQHLSQLESDLEVRLFNRQIRKLTLTAAGHRLFSHTREIFESSQRLLDVVSPLSLGSYPIAIGLVPSASIQLAYKIIGDFQEKYGSVGMKLRHSTYGELETGLLNSQLDFGFSDRIPERKDICHQLLSGSEIKFYVSSKWWSKGFSSLLEKLPLLICNVDPATQTMAEKLLRENDFPVGHIIVSDFPSVLTDLCQRGLGIGVFAEGQMKDMNILSLKSLRTPDGAPKIQDRIYAVWPAGGENTEAIRKLQEILPPSGQK